MPSKTSAAVGRIVGTLFVLSVACSVAVWGYIVAPVLGGDMRGHETHAGLRYAHAASGTLLLFFGAARALKRVVRSERRDRRHARASVPAFDRMLRHGEDDGCSHARSRRPRVRSAIMRA